MKIFRQFLILFPTLIVLISCGDSENNVPDIREFSISPSGGIAEIANTVKIEFPKDTFSSDVKLLLQERTEPEIVKNYSETALLFDAGKSVEKSLKIIAPVQPVQNVVIHYTVPQEFIDSLGKNFKPRLFVHVHSYGANDEEFDTFEPLPFRLNKSVLTASIPPEAFTAVQSKSQTQFEAVVLIGSSPADRVQESSAAALEVPTNLTKSSSDSCQGATIGGPLEGKIESISDFGPRIDPLHPETHRIQAHVGVDLKAKEGDNVLAVADGKIEVIKENSVNPKTGRGFGHYVVLLHNDGSRTLYGHLIISSTAHLKEGVTVVTKGTMIGTADSTGGTTGPHLHLSYAPNGKIFDKDSNIDPLPCINANLSGQITVSDNGRLADDSFSLTLDGLLIGSTNIGASNTFAVNNLRPGEHTIRIDVLVAPDNKGTLQVGLGKNATFSDGSKSKSEVLPQGGSISYTIIISAPPKL